MRRILILLLLLTATLCSALERQPNADYRARRLALAARTNGGAVVLFAATEPEGPDATYGFRQDNNFFYLTGWPEPGAAVLIAPATERSGGAPARPYTEILFLPAHNPTQERWTGPKLTADHPEARQITGFDRVELLDRLRDELVQILPQARALVYSDLGKWDSASPSQVPLQWQRRANAFPNYVSFVDVKPLITELRLRKDAGEIAPLGKATEATMAGFRAVMASLRPGISEREVAALIQYEYTRRGCERPAFDPIVGSGFNSTVLHYLQKAGTIADGELVVIDAGGEYSMYATDITRTLPASGKFTARQREIYEIVLGAQDAAIAAFRLGKSTLLGSSANSLHKIAYDYINAHGRDLHGHPLGQYFIHSLSHYVGLEVHDVGDRTRLIEKGMVFTIEPGIYIPEEKLGVRIEDMYYVDEGGKLVNLTSGLARTVEQIERAMAK